MLATEFLEENKPSPGKKPRRGKNKSPGMLRPQEEVLNDLHLDDWQHEVLHHEGDIFVLKGRRIGATDLFARKMAERMIRPKTGRQKEEIVCISLSEDQAQLIIMFALEHLEKYYPAWIDRSPAGKPTLKTITTINGSTMEVRPVGATGDGVRGFNGTILGVDEAPKQPKKMWAAARPILTTTNGEIWMWGTPGGKEGYPWEQYDSIINKKKPGRFKIWHLNSEEVLLNRKVSPRWTADQAAGAARVLAEERASMSEVEYGNEYLGQFLDDVQQFFSPEWIERVCSGLKGQFSRSARLYMGVDCARFGKDESTWAAAQEESGRYWCPDFKVDRKLDIVQGVDKTCNIAELWNPRKIGLDAGAGTIGVSWLDLLRRTKWKHKVIPLNNRAITIEITGDDKEVEQRMLKADMYYNLLAMGEKGELTLPNDPEFKASLASVQLNYVQTPAGKTRVEIFGSKGAGGDHIAEAVVRAFWLAKHEKGLNLWAR